MREKQAERSLASWGGAMTSTLISHGHPVSKSSLSDILEPNAPSKYYLSEKACRGILRRAERRGKELPEALRRALKQRSAVVPADEDGPTTQIA